MSALAYLGWTAAGACGALAALLQARLVRHAGLVADAGHELRGPLCAARLGLHALDDEERAAAVDLELRRAALALDDLAAACHGRRAGERSQLVDVGALLDDAAEAWQPLARAFGAELSGRAAARARARPRRPGPARAGVREPRRQRGRARRLARPRARARARGSRARRGPGRRPGAAGPGVGADRESGPQRRPAHHRALAAVAASRPLLAVRRGGRSSRPPLPAAAGSRSRPASPSATAAGSRRRRARPARASCSSCPAPTDRLRPRR